MGRVDDPLPGSARAIEPTASPRYLYALRPGVGRRINVGRVIGLEVIVQDGESLERALRKFKRKVQRSGLYSELRKRRFYEKPSAQRKRKREAAIRRERRKQRRDPRPHL